MNYSNKYSFWAFGFLAGGLAGASVALLLAPQSGRATREAMRGRMRATVASARGLKDRVVRQVEELRSETTRRVGEAASALAGHGAGNGADTGADAGAAV